jgi:hypothetical protein
MIKPYAIKLGKLYTMWNICVKEKHWRKVILLICQIAERTAKYCSVWLIGDSPWPDEQLWFWERSEINFKNIVEKPVVIFLKDSVQVDKYTVKEGMILWIHRWGLLVIPPWCNISSTSWLSWRWLPTLTQKKKRIPAGLTVSWTCANKYVALRFPYSCDPSPIKLSWARLEYFIWCNKLGEVFSLNWPCEMSSVAESDYARLLSPTMQEQCKELIVKRMALVGVLQTAL